MRPSSRSLVPALSLALSLAGSAAPAATGPEVLVKDAAALSQAIRAATPGTRILLAPGDYAGGLYFTNVMGAPGRPITIGAADPARPPRVVGGGNNLQFNDAAYLELRDLVLTGGKSSGLHIHDGGSFDTPCHHVTLRNLTVSDVTSPGNYDGMKLSGLDDFRIENCTIERYGGQGIDMVGCHRGVIEGCRFRQDGRERVDGPEGVQAKGGTSQIVVRQCTFEPGIGRGVNLGGSTGLQFFRPKVQGYEAKEITVEGCVFDRCGAPVAYVGLDGGVVRCNTIYLPVKWALRILQETTAPGFVPSRNGAFENNVVVFRSDRWGEGGVNIGPNTAPQTFRFAGNVWYCQDQPQRSQPRLPTPETGGVVGQDPLLRAPGEGDFSLRPGSPAVGKGHTALPDRAAP